MTTLTIHIPDKKTKLIKQLLKELDVKIEMQKTRKKASRMPNVETIRAIEDARNGKVQKITDLKAFLEGI